MVWYTGSTSGNHYLDLLDKLIDIMTSNSLATATVSNGGTGYAVGDICTLTGGTFSPSAAKVRVTSVAAGVVDGIVIEEGGAYTVNPSTPTSTSGGTGSGLTVSTTFASNGWTNNMDNTPSGEREVWLEGTGSGSDEIHVGFKTFNQLSHGGIDQAYSWGVVAATGHNGGLDWWEQPGISPGFDSSGDPDAGGGAFVPLKTTDASYPIDYWISVTPRRVILVAKVENASITHYSSLYVGFQNQVGTSSEYPYPIYVSGSSYRPNTYYGTSSPRYTSISEAMGHSTVIGPAFYRTFDDLWKTVKNSSANDIASPSRSTSDDYTIYPSGESYWPIGETYDHITRDDAYNLTWSDIIPSTGIPGTATYRMQPTPNTGDDLYPLIPCTLVATKDDGGRNDLDVLGELDSVYWITGGGGVSSEDYVEDSSNVRYRIFQSGNQSEIFSFFAVKEN
jgi:hypothetical protein